MSPDPVYLSNPKSQQQSGLSEEATLVRNTLVQHGLETPMIETVLNPEQKYARIKQLMSEVDYLLQSHHVTGRVLPMDGGRHLR